MHRYVVFLRAINVGGRTVKMDQLREMFASFGYAGTETFIASGNVIIQTDERDMSVLTAHIETSLEKSLGYSVPAMVRTVEELEAIDRYRPFTDAEFEEFGESNYVWLLRDAPAPGICQILKDSQTPDDLLHAHGREVYWISRTKLSLSALPVAKLERAFGTPCTMRNMNTIRRMVAKYA